MKRRKYKAIPNKKAGQNIKPKENKQKNIRLAIAEATDLPKEIVLGLPLLTIIGTSELRIENFKNIIEFSDEKIRINTSCGILRIEGKKLVLAEISSRSISVKGSIVGYHFG